MSHEVSALLDSRPSPRKAGHEKGGDIFLLHKMPQDCPWGSSKEEHVINPSSTGISRQDAFGGSEIELSSEVHSGALAAQAEAEVKARWAIALRAPRNLDQVRVSLLKECDRPGFAEVAKYSRPMGGDRVVGPSIRFVEAALKCMRNVMASMTVVSEDAKSRRVQVMVTDLETNVSWPRQITIEKTVERKSPKNRTVLGERTNSKGETVYVVVATEEEFAAKEAAYVSKAIRQSGLRIIPGDLIEEAMARVDQVRSARTKADPSGARKKLVDGFVLIGVSPDQLAEYLGHPLDLLQPGELEDLRDLYAAIRDGETRWSQVMEQRREEDPVRAPPNPQAPSPKPSPPGARASDLEEKMRSSVEQVQATGEMPRPVPLSPLDEVLKAIGSAEKPADLNPITRMINRLSEEEKVSAVAAYSARAKELRGSK